MIIVIFSVPLSAENPFSLQCFVLCFFSNSMLLQCCTSSIEIFQQEENQGQIILGSKLFSLSSFPLSICVFFLFVYVSVPMRASSEVLSYSHVFKESFPLGREAALLAEHAILDDKGAVDAHLIGQVSKSTWLSVEYHVSPRSPARPLFHPLHGESLILWSSVLFSQFLIFLLSILPPSIMCRLGLHYSVRGRCVRPEWKVHDQ